MRRRTGRASPSAGASPSVGASPAPGPLLAPALLLALGPLMALGCGDGGSLDPAPPADDPLTAAETVAMFEGVRELTRDSTLTVIREAENGLVVACPEGGEASLAVELDTRAGPSEDNIVLEMALLAIPRDCAFAAGGRTFVVSSQDGIAERATLTFSTALELLDGTGTARGTVDWRLDDRAGSCEIDVAASIELTVTGEDAVLNTTYEGSVCGHEVELVLPEGGLVP